MGGREAMAFSCGSVPFYRDGGGDGDGVGIGIGIGGSGVLIGGLNLPAGFRHVSNTGVPTQALFQGSSIGSAFSAEPSHVSFPHGIDMGTSSDVPLTKPVKKKRGRPRKYCPDEPVSLGLSPIPAAPNPSLSPNTPAEKRGRGRPPGSGRKQQLAPLGEWMNSSAGLAFAPHVITIAVGEDIAAKILSFSQQRPRALCILSGSGSVSSVTLRHPASSRDTVTYEGDFKILSLSGSYLTAEDGSPHNRTGGISVSLSGPDGQVFGGRVGTLIASSPVQVIACSFVYGGSEAKNKQVGGLKGDKDSGSS